MILVKPESTPFPQASFPLGVVQLYHPLYTFDSLASLPSVDTTETGKTGVHFGLVTECFHIFSGGQHGNVHKFDAASTTVGSIVEMAYDEVLDEGCYCWVLRATNGSDWAIVPNFRNWIPISNDEMPDAWQRAFPSMSQSGAEKCTSMSKGVAARDQECRVSRARDALKGTHTIPRAEREWFALRGAPLRNIIRDLDSLRNGVGLEAGLHVLYNQGVWCFVPKQGKVVVHFFKAAHESYTLHSNRVSQPLMESFPSLFYARLAWVILEQGEEFFESKFAEKVRVRVGEGGGYKEMTCASWRKEEEAEQKAKGEEEDKSSLKRTAGDEAGGDSSRIKREEMLADMREGAGEVASRFEGDPNISPSTSPPPTTELRYDELPEELKLEVDSWVEGDEMRKLTKEALRRERARNGIEMKEEAPEREEPVPWQLRYPFDQMGRWVEQAKRLKEDQRRKESNAE